MNNRRTNRVNMNNKFAKENGFFYLNVVAGNFLFKNIRHTIDNKGYLKIDKDDFILIKSKMNSRFHVFGQQKQITVNGQLKGIIERNIKKNVKGPSLNEYYFFGKERPYIHDSNFRKSKSTENKIASHEKKITIKTQNIQKEINETERVLIGKFAPFNSHDNQNQQTSIFDTDQSTEEFQKFRVEKEEVVKQEKRQKLSEYQEHEIIDSINYGSYKPVKSEQRVTITQRNQQLAQNLKDLYNDSCQICGTRIDLGNGKSMSEVHHIRPISAHNGPDVSDNMVVVCPNCHTLFDRGAITIDLLQKSILHINPDHPLNGKGFVCKHKINSEYIQYHNLYIFKTRETSDV